MHNLGDIVGGRYRINKELSTGGFGTTYFAEYIEIGKQSQPVVVKTLSPRFLAKKRFVNQAIVLQRLGNHDQIPGLLDYFEENKTFYLVQEFIDGQNLKEELKGKVLSEEEVIALLQDVLKILAFVHHHGFIHRDINPSNLIQRRSDGKMVLIDFRAVKEIGTLSIDPNTSKKYTHVIGTPGYMSPEQYDGKPIYSSDIYGLGRTAIYALTGRVPLELENKQTGELDKWQEFGQVSNELAAILDKMVRPKYAERYHSAVEVLHDLQPLLKIGKTVGIHYKIIRYLRGGIWGHIYLAQNLQRRYQSPCVIKQLKPQTINPSTLREAECRFLTEVKVLEKLGHHGQIPQLWDHFEENEEFYLVQEFIEGEDINKELQEGKRLSEEMAIALLQDVLEILDFIHQHGVIHCDIKPSNLIQRRSDGKFVLIDFGMVKEIANLSPDGTESTSSTPTFSSDIYALGTTAIQALTGVSPDQLQRNPQTGEVIWREGTQVSQGLAKILDKMVRLDLEKRYQSAAEVLETLRKAKRQGVLPPFKPWYWYILVPLIVLSALLFVL